MGNYEDRGSDRRDSGRGRSRGGFGGRDRDSSRGGFGGKDRGSSRGGFGGRDRGSSRGGFGGRDRGRSGGRGFGGRSRSDMMPHKVTCDGCGIECEVPFKPTAGKPVYCEKCFKGGNQSRGPSKSRSQPAKDYKEDFEKINSKIDYILKELKEIKEQVREKKFYEDVASPEKKVTKKPKKEKKEKKEKTTKTKKTKVKKTKKKKE